MLSSVEHLVKLSGAPNSGSHSSGAPLKKQRQVVSNSERGKSSLSLSSIGQLSLLRLQLPGRHAGGSRVVAMASTAMPQSTNTLSSWESLSASCGNGSEEAERLPNAKTRVFEAGQEPKLVFYRDNSSWCPYCERVWMQLEEKRIPYSVEKINMRCYGEKPAWFTRMVPSGLLPVLQVDGRVVTESMEIMFLIESQFPEDNPLLPAEGSPEMKAVEPLLQLERALAGAWLSRLRSSWPDMNGFENAMDKVNSALMKFGGPYFLGSKVPDTNLMRA